MRGKTRGDKGEGRRGDKCRECRNNVLVYRSAEPMDGNSYTSTPDSSYYMCSEMPRLVIYLYVLVL